MVLLHEHKHEDGIKNFFLDVWEAYLKVRTILFSLSLSRARSLRVFPGCATGCLTQSLIQMFARRTGLDEPVSRSECAHRECCLRRARPSSGEKVSLTRASLRLLQHPCNA